MIGTIIYVSVSAAIAFVGRNKEKLAWVLMTFEGTTTGFEVQLSVGPVCSPGDAPRNRRRYPDWAFSGDQHRTGLIPGLLGACAGFPGVWPNAL
jgi:hypothetical protein